MTAEIQTTVLPEFSPDVRELLAYDTSRRQAQAMARERLRGAMTLESLGMLENRLEPGSPVLVINHRPARRTDDKGPATGELLFGILGNNQLMADNWQTIGLPTDCYCRNATLDVTGRNDETIMDQDTPWITGLLPLIPAHGPEMRFPGYGQTVLIGTAEMQSWFAERPKEASAYLSLCVMFYAATSQVLETDDPALIDIREKAVRWLRRKEKLLSSPPTGWDEAEVERQAVKLALQLKAIGGQELVLED